MSTGKISELHPPTNNGTANGSGKITMDGDGKRVNFHTPRDNNGEVISTGQSVQVKLDSNGKLDSFSGDMNG